MFLASSFPALDKIVSRFSNVTYCLSKHENFTNIILDLKTHTLTTVLLPQEATPSKEEEILREHVNELREKLRTLHSQHEDEIEQYKQREEHVRKTMQKLQEKHKEEVEEQQQITCNKNNISQSLFEYDMKRDVCQHNYAMCS